MVWHETKDRRSRLVVRHKLKPQEKKKKKKERERAGSEDKDGELIGVDVVELAEGRDAQTFEVAMSFQAHPAIHFPNNLCGSLFLVAVLSLFTRCFNLPVS